MSPPDPSLHPLIVALQAGVSSAAGEREGALVQLKSWENQAGYYPSLVELFANQELDLGPARDMIRFQAVTAFKNGVAAHWRRGATHGIPEGEKEQIRPRLLVMVNEVDNKVAGSVALCLAQIARIDYGTTWEELPATLLASIEFGLNPQAPPDQARLVLHRSLFFLHKVFKALASNRMQRGRLLSQTVCQATFATVCRLYQALVLAEFEALRTTGAPSPKRGHATDMEVVRLAFKCLAKMMLYGFVDSSRDPTAKEFFQASVVNFQNVFALRLSVMSAGTPASEHVGALAQLTEHLAKYVKMYRAVLAQNPKTFIDLGSTVEIVQTVWHVIEGAGADVAKIDQENVFALYPERFVVKSMMLLKESMGNWASASPIEIPAGFAKNYAELLVTRLMPLREGDLERWNDDPEEWMAEEEAERWEFDLRPCAEHVLQSLVSGYVDEIGPMLVQLVQQASAITTEDGLLFKESVYCAFGKSSNLLRKFIGFDSWLSHTLVNEAAGADPAFALVRRRIAWLVGDWIAELDDDSGPARVQIYALLGHLLGQNPSTDLAIRLTAARSLARCCDAWDFKMDEFGPFLPAAVDGALALLREVEQAEAQTRLSKTLNVLVDRAGAQVLPFAEPLMQALGHLWAAASESQLRISILVTFTALVVALNEHSQPLQEPGAAIIVQSVDTSSEAHIYLLEDGLELWHALLKRSSALSPAMLGLLPALLHHLAAGTDVLPRCLRILESYLLLDAGAVLRAHCADLFVVLESLLGELKLEAVKAILHALDTVLRTTPCQSWIGALDGTDAIGKLIYPIMKHEQIQIVTKYLTTLARIVVAGPAEFVQLVQSWAVRHGHAPDEVLAAIINEWIERVDYMAQGGQRKLTALALAYLLPTGHAVVLDHLQDYVPLWNSVMAQTEEDANGDAELYAVPDDYEDQIDYDTAETLETVRRQAMAAQDVVRTVRLASVIGAKVGEVQASQGGFEAVRAKYLAGLDPLILEELVKRLEGQLAG